MARKQEAGSQDLLPLCLDPVEHADGSVAPTVKAAQGYVRGCGRNLRATCENCGVERRYIVLECIGLRCESRDRRGISLLAEPGHHLIMHDHRPERAAQMCRHLGPIAEYGTLRKPRMYTQALGYSAHDGIHRRVTGAKYQHRRTSQNM